ncbi:MAG: hypothetical protein GW893_19725 [Armatimonadetes bacterium]|nr:hypothetical protein [Armatimonadota bacterium]
MRNLCYRWLAMVGGLSLVLVSAGCFKASTIMKVNQDGAGTIFESMAMREATVQQIIGMMSGFAGAGKGPTVDEFMPLDQFKGKAGDYGPGVKYVKANKSRENGFIKVEAEYSFSDVTKVKLPTSNQPDMPGSTNEGKPEYLAFGLVRNVRDGNSELTIRMPPPKPETTRGGTETDTQPQQGEGDAEGGEALLALFKDMEVTVAVECGKEVLSTNATNREGNRVTLLHFAFDKLLAHPEKLKELQKRSPKPESLDAIKDLLKDIEGIKIEVQQEVKVKYQ